MPPGAYSRIYGNNTLRYSKDNGSTWKTITFMKGNYTYIDIGNFVENSLETNSDSKTGIKIYYVWSVKKVYIGLKTGCEVEFRDNSSFCQLIGFDNLLTSSGNGTLTPNITNSIGSIILTTLLLSSSMYDNDTR